MTLAVATIPDDPARLPGWLDEQLVGDRLGDLVAELAGVHGPAPVTEIVAGRLAPHLPAVLARGLAALPLSEIRYLLTHPALLLQLQEEVLLNGGQYWDRVPRSDALTSQISRGWERVQLALATAGPVVPLTLVREASRRWYREPWAVSLATAAAVLIAVAGVWQVAGPAREPDGWVTASRLPKDVDARQYLNALADAAEALDRRPTETPEALAAWINEYRRGCSQIILAPHPPLSETQRAELKKRCANWARQFDAALVKLESGADVATVRGEMDAVVKKLATVLRTDVLNA